MIKSIIFDFDGVIADTNHVKTDAFVKLFNNYPEDTRHLIKRFHLENGGMSRFDKFKYIYANILNEPLAEKKLDELCKEFHALVVYKVINADMVKGAMDFLERNREKYTMYIVSGTPESEIREIVKKRNLDIYFSGVYGSPKSKKDLIESILKENGYTPNEVVFIGDSINDYEGASGSGVKFVAMTLPDSDKDMFLDADIKYRVTSIKEFEELLVKNLKLK